MALSLQDQGQQQAAASGARDGDAKGRRLTHGESVTGEVRTYGVRSGICVVKTTS
jgi:hypothetical protein